VSKLNIVFYYPSRVVGGAEWLFIRMARALSEIQTHHVSVVDFHDGFLKSKLKDSKVWFIEHQPTRRAKIAEDAIVIVPISHIGIANKNLDLPDSTRVLLWSIHPHNILYLLLNAEWLYTLTDQQIQFLVRYFFPSAFARVRLAIKIAQEKFGLAVMDVANQRSIEKTLGFQLKPTHFLPIPLESSESRTVTNHDALLKITWVGRISDDKVFALLRVLSDVQAYALKTNALIRVNVVGSGHKQKFLKARLNRFPKVDICELGTLDNTELARFLTTQTDVVVAMGTSLIEAARYGIPTILVDACYQMLPAGLPYQWFFELHGFDLGAVVSRKNLPTQGSSLQSMLEQLQIPNQPERLGCLCFAHFRQFHQLEQVVASCQDILLHNSLTAKDLRDAALISRRRKLK
jgi:glycosyltransferase involved in cell wall biosynthesis